MDNGVSNKCLDVRHRPPAYSWRASLRGYRRREVLGQDTIVLVIGRFGSKLILKEIKKNWGIAPS